MHDHRAVVHEDPSGGRFSLHVQRQQSAPALHFFAHARGQGPQLAFTGTAADDEAIGQCRQFVDVQ